MSLRQTIQDDLKQSMKQQQEERLSVLRLLWDVIIKKEKEKRMQLEDVVEDKIEKESQLNDEEIQQLIISSIKKNKDAIEQFKQGVRDDLAEKNQREIAILEKYLPEQLSEQEISVLVEKAIQEIQAKGPSDFGKIIGKVMAQAKGRTDGGTVSRIVKEKLSQ
jgi:uncharacterized protein YqeY